MYVHILNMSVCIYVSFCLIYMLCLCMNCCLQALNAWSPVGVAIVVSSGNLRVTRGVATEVGPQMADVSVSRLSDNDIASPICPPHHDVLPKCLEPSDSGLKPPTPQTKPSPPSLKWFLSGTGHGNTKGANMQIVLGLFPFLDT